MKKEIIEYTPYINYVGTTICNYIKSGYLDEIIKKLNKEKTIPNVCVLKITKKGYITSTEQFCQVLAQLEFFFEKNFPTLYPKEHFFKMLIENKTPEFLLSKKYIGDAENIHYYQFEMEKFFVENMYVNIKYIYSYYKDFFKKLKIKQNISFDNYSDVHNLFLFMKNLVWCNYNKPQLEYVFSTLLNGLLYVKRGKSKEEKTNIEKNYTSKFMLGWDSLINNYQVKVEYVKKILN